MSLFLGVLYFGMDYAITLCLSMCTHYDGAVRQNYPLAMQGFSYQKSAGLTILHFFHISRCEKIAH